MSSVRNLEDVDEEFNNFLHRVNEVNDIVKKLSSQDKKVQEIGTLEADRYLNDKSEIRYENLCEDTLKLKISTNRTVINKKALMRDDKGQNTMSQEAFMESVSKDAEMRYKDKMVRKERAETLKTRANKAFRRGEYEKALTLFDKAIEQIKDSCMLYINRALTQINLRRYEKAVADAENALYFNENSLKARLVLAKAHFLNHNRDWFRAAIKEAKERHKEQTDFINEFAEDFKNST